MLNANASINYSDVQSFTQQQQQINAARLADNISLAEEKEAMRELERRSGSSISNPLCSDFPVGVVPEHNIPQLIWFGQNFPKIRKVG